MKKDVLKVRVKNGKENEFENYCKENDIYCRSYPTKSLKSVYRAECKSEQLKGAELLIKSVEDMPKLTLS